MYREFYLMSARDFLRKSFGLDRALDITTDGVDAYIVSRRDTEVAKPATIHYELAILKRMFSLAVEKGKLNQKPRLRVFTGATRDRL